MVLMKINSISLIIIIFIFSSACDSLIPKRTKKLLDFSKVGGRKCRYKANQIESNPGQSVLALVPGRWLFISMIHPTNGTRSPDLGRLQLLESDQLAQS